MHFVASCSLNNHVQRKWVQEHSKVQCASIWFHDTMLTSETAFMVPSISVLMDYIHFHTSDIKLTVLWFAPLVSSHCHLSANVAVVSERGGCGIKVRILVSLLCSPCYLWLLVLMD